MTLQQLQYIVALAEHRHFSKAAAACFVSQPTLSMQVRQLEDELDVVLFQRKQQPLRPTVEGERIVGQARLVLREAEQLWAITHELHGGLEGTYRIGIIPTLAPYLLPLFLPGFASAHPEVRSVIDERRTSRILKSLRKGELDIGILVTPVDQDVFEEIPLFQEPFLAYLPNGHVHWRKRTLHRKDLHHQALRVLGEGHCFREQALSLCEQPSSAGHDNVLYESGSIETLKQLVRKGTGMTLVPELAVEPGDPHVRRFSAPEPVRQVSLVVRRPFARRKLLDVLSESIRSKVPAHMLRKGVVAPLNAGVSASTGH